MRSPRIREPLKRNARELAMRQSVSLNNRINATVAAAVAQEEALAFFDDRLKDMDLEALHRRVVAFMRDTRPGPEPSPDEVRHATGRP